MSVSARDIGFIPNVRYPERKEDCRKDFKLFCEIYFSGVFNLGWSDDHLIVIGIIQNAVLNGGLFAVAMPRGSGKTSLVLAAAVWSLVYGHRSFVVLIAASEDHAIKLLKNIGADFETNDELLEDFPEVCYPIRRLERIVHRANGQLLDGEPTRIQWTAKELVLPTVPNSVASGSRVVVAGITGSIRGMMSKLADGTSIRPDLALVDDPQTTESAGSPKQIHDRLAIINGDILGLAGPKQKISAVMPCTVIQRNDLADQALNRKINPAWQGVRTAMLRSLPTNVKLWEAYGELWADGLRADGTTTNASAFYKANQNEMDAGAEASWEDRFNDDEISAIQNAMNLKLRDEPSFFAEYQNEPVALNEDTPLLLKPEQVTAKIIPIERGIVPSASTKLTAFIDVQGTLLYYCVVAWTNAFSGHVVDYGAWPEQRKNYFFLREALTFSDVPDLKKIAVEGQLRQALERLCKSLLERDYDTDTQGSMKISRLLIDSGYQETLVKQFVRESGVLRSMLMASKGFGIGANKAPMSTWKSTEGDRTGWNWIWNPKKEHILFDTYEFKTFVARRLTGTMGELGNLSIFEASPSFHKMFSEHCTSEYPVAKEGGGRIVNEWKQRPQRENHLWDCLVGCAVAASEQGLRFAGHQEQTGLPKAATGRRRRISVRF